MSLDFVKISNELFAKIKTQNFNKNNKSHMDALEELLSEYIEDEELLFHILITFKHPNMIENNK